MDALVSIALGNATIAALLATLAAVVGRRMQGRRPALVHGLWLIALLKLLTPPLMTIPVAGGYAAEVGVSGRKIFVDDVERPADVAEPFTFDPEPLPIEDETLIVPVLVVESGPLPGLSWRWRWPTVALLAWAIGGAGWLGLLGWRVRRFGAVLRAAVDADGETNARAARLTGRLGLRSTPRLQFVPGRVVPMLWALGGAPRILLPRALWDRLDDAQRETLLAHELAHLRRRDHRVRLLELAATGLYWWLPVAWWVRRGLRRAEEACCDAWVAWALPGSSRAYATALLMTAEFLSESDSDLDGGPERGDPRVVPPFASGMGQAHDLSRRMTMILRDEPSRGLTWSGRLALIALTCLLPLMPAMARPSLDDDPPADLTALAEAAVRTKTAQIAEAEALFQKAVAAVDRLKMLATKGIVSVQEIEAADRDVELARASLASRREELAEANLRLEQARRRMKSVDAKSNPEVSREANVDLRSRRDAPPALRPFRDADAAVDSATEAAKPQDRPAIDRRIDALENKLDRVLRELDELRRDRERPKEEARREAPKPATATDWLALSRKLVDASFDLATKGTADFPEKDLIAKIYEEALGRRPTDAEAKRADDLLDRAKAGDITQGDAMNALSQALAGLREFREHKAPAPKVEEAPVPATVSDADIDRLIRRRFIELQTPIDGFAGARDSEQHEQMIGSAYGLVLKRLPTTEEVAKARRAIVEAEAIREGYEGRRQAYEDLVWSLLNSEEHRRQLAKPRRTTRPAADRRPPDGAEVRVAFEATRGPLVVGWNTEFAATLRNIGVEDAKNVRVVVELTDNLQIVGSSFPVDDGRIEDGRRVTFSTLGRIASGDLVKFTVSAKAIDTGPGICRVFLTYDGLEKPIEFRGSRLISEAVDNPRREFRR